MSRAEHEFIGAAGEPATLETATGISYAGAEDNQNWPAGKVFSHQLSGAVPGEIKTMAGLFGYRTVATNTISGCYDQVPAGSPKGTPRPRKETAPATDYDALESRFAAIATGDWGAAERGGGGGIGFNIDLMVEAIGKVKEKVKQPFDAEATRATLKSDAAYRAKVRTVTPVMVEYAKLSGKGGDVSDI